MDIYNKGRDTVVNKEKEWFVMKTEVVPHKGSRIQCLDYNIVWLGTVVARVRGQGRGRGEYNKPK